MLVEVSSVLRCAKLLDLILTIFMRVTFGSEIRVNWLQR